jgi:toxin-antitoxin system PIN domain toxin
MNTLNFLDASVWLALLWSRHIHSDKANRWFENTGEERFLFCRITQVTVLRLLTTQAVMGKDVKKMHEAWELWDQVCADDRIEILSEPEAIEREFRSVSSLRSPSPKVWADAYLLAFASVAGLKLITFDRGLRARGVDVQIL